MVFSTFGISTPLVFGCEQLNSNDSSEPSHALATAILSAQEECLKIIELSQKLTSPLHRNTFANKLARQYLWLAKAGTSPELLEQIRSTAKELWLKNIPNESVLTLKVIGKHFVSLGYPDDAEMVYELALQKALTHSMKDELKRLLAQLNASSQELQQLILRVTPFSGLEGTEGVYD
jgi:hypothetical protein